MFKKLPFGGFFIGFCTPDKIMVKDSMADNTKTPTVDLEDIKAFDLTLEILEGFLPMAETDTAKALPFKIFKMYVDSLPADSLADIYNDRAVDGDEITVSEFVDRLCTDMVLKNLVDRCYEVRKFVLQPENADLREIYKISELQDLETYLGVAASFVMKTYDDEETDEKRFYDAKTIAETTRVHIENSPLIGANDDAQPSPPPAFRLN